MSHSPAEILAEYLTDQAIFSATLTDDWAIFISHLPESPSRAAVVYDTQGFLDGRYMDDGTVIEHQGVSLMVRGKDSDYALAQKKLDDAVTVIEQIKNVTVVIDGSSYIIDAVSKIAGSGSLGVPDSQRRPQWSTNHTLSITFTVALKYLELEHGGALLLEDGLALLLE